MVSKLRRKIEHLREQPEAVRLRAATLLTGGTGIAVVLLWLFLLLPLQIRLNRPSDAVSELRPEQALLEAGQDVVSQGIVSGVSDLPLPLSSVTPIPSPLPY